MLCASPWTRSAPAGAPLEEVHAATRDRISWALDFSASILNARPDTPERCRRHSSREVHGLIFRESAVLSLSAGLRSASRAWNPGAYKIRMGAVPDRGRGLGHTAPTYVS